LGSWFGDLDEVLKMKSTFFKFLKFLDGGEVWMMSRYYIIASGTMVREGSYD